MDPITVSVIKIFFLAAFSSILALFLTPTLTNFLYRHKLWRKNARTKTIDGKSAEFFLKFHKEKEISTPRFGGFLIWGTVLITALIFWLLSHLFPDSFWFQKLNFFSRNQTWLPIFALVTAAFVGLVDDILQTKGKGKYIAGGLTFWQRFFVVVLIGLIGGWWFSAKLEISTLHIPGNGEIFLGQSFCLADFCLGFSLIYILLFIIVMLACWSGGVIDGLDGLAGGVFASIFAAFGIIAFSRNQIDLAAFCFVLTGSILSFLWFNIPPARFYMGETGSLALTSVLAVVAFLTDSVLVLPIIGGLLVVESGSVILQLLAKKFLKRKIFLSTPIHHHFQAKGWPETKIVMRFWVVGVVLAIIGIAIRLLG